MMIKLLKRWFLGKDVPVPDYMRSDTEWYLKNEAEKVWLVRWANGKGVTYWSSEEAAKAFQELHPGDASEPKLIDKPAGATVREWPNDVKEDDLKTLGSVIERRRYLVPPHGEMIYDGKKKAIVASKPYKVDEDFQILVSGKLAYGYIRMKPYVEISLEDFKKQVDKHKVSDTERQKWWGDKPLFMAGVRNFIPLERPVKEIPPKGIQTHYTAKPLLEAFEPEAYDPDKLKKMTALELLNAHSALFDEWVKRGKKKGDELVINANLLILSEMKRRGAQAPKENELDEVSKAWSVKAEIEDSIQEGKYLDRAIKSAKQIQALGPIVLVPDYISWTGSNMWAEKRTPNDLDVIVRDTKLPGGAGAALKISRVAQRYFGSDPHITLDVQGPNWDYLPQWDLALIPKSEIKAVKVNEQGFASRFYEQLARAAGPKILAQAERAKKHDKITLGEFYYVMKPTYAVQPEERQTIDGLVNFFKKGGVWPVRCEKKYDGNNCETHIDGDKVLILSEDGTPITDRFPKTIEAFKALKEKSVSLLAEIELWDGKKHLPREAIRGYIGSKDAPDDSNVVFNVYGVLYHDGEDLHKLSEDERRKHLEMIKFPQSTNDEPNLKYRLNLVPSPVAKDANELEKLVKDLSHRPASEGVVAKRGDAIYHLDGSSRGRWSKYHKSVVLYGIVIERIETKTPGTYNYRYGLDFGKESVKPGDIAEVKDEEFIELGKTFSTSRKANRGQIIQVEAETFNYIEDERTGTVSASAWAPRFLGISTERNRPDTLESVRNRSRKEEVLQEKSISKEGVTIYECDESIEYLAEDEYYTHASQNVGGQARQLVCDFLQAEEEQANKELQEAESILSEALTKQKFEQLQRTAEKKPKYHAVLERHFRGKSAHADFRVKMNGHLEGWTLTDAPASAIKEDVDTLEKGRDATKTVDWKFNPEMKPIVHVVAIRKAKQPLIWTVVNDKYLGRDAVMPPGSVGATRFDEGVFILEAEGKAYKGIQKPYFYEYFLDMPARFGMKPYKGRFITRLIGVRKEWEKPPKGAVQWQAKMTKEETPYLLTRRGRTRKDYAPEGEDSALPPWWEEKVKPEFRWWVKGLSRNEKLKRMDKAYNDLLEREILKGFKIPVKEERLAEKKARFALRRHHWRGQFVVRGVPVQHWDLKIDSGKNYLDSFGHMERNPVDHPKGVAALHKKWNLKPPGGKDFKDWISMEHIEIPPNKPELGNPNKRIPAFSDLDDSGEVEIIEENPMFVSFQFKGKKLKGYWIMKREDPKAPLWVFSKSALPGQPKENISLTDDDFPVKIAFGDMEYTLVKTGQGKLRLGGKNEN